LLAAVPILCAYLDHRFEIVHCFNALMVAMCLLAWREYSAMALPGRKSWHLAGVAVIAACGATMWFRTAGYAIPVAALRAYFVPAAFFAALGWAAVSWDGERPTFAEGAIWFAGILYLAYLPAYLFELRTLENGDGLLVLFVVAVKVGDSGAYFFGRALGRLKFFSVSPRKTIEGAVGGLATACITAVVGARYFLPEGAAGDGAVLAVAVVVSVAAQAGDLIESLLKRSFGTKHSASVVPEMGGALDMIDSLLFAAPVLFFLVTGYR
jgi:CDP-diglyceride synthetase